MLASFSGYALDEDSILNPVLGCLRIVFRLSIRIKNDGLRMMVKIPHKKKKKKKKKHVSKCQPWQPSYIEKNGKLILLQGKY